MGRDQTFLTKEEPVTKPSDGGDRMTVTRTDGVTMRRRQALGTAIASLVTATVLVSGCAVGDSTEKSAARAGAAASEHGSHDGMSMSEMGDIGTTGGPSKPALMICSDEIHSAVKRTVGSSAVPEPTHNWSKSNRVFTCTYELQRGTVRLSVQDAVHASSGRAFYTRLRAGSPKATALSGMQNFGFQAFQTPSGNVVFLKDGKTLQVDATALSRAALPSGFTRTDVAYGIASAVIACWTE